LDDETRAFGSGYRDHGRLFCHPDGGPLHPDMITRRFNGLVDKAGVPQIRLQTCGTRTRRSRWTPASTSRLSVSALDTRA
jgi:hypothetical protein